MHRSILQEVIRWAWGDAPDWFEKIRDALYSAIGSAILAALYQFLSDAHVTAYVASVGGVAGALLEMSRQFLRAKATPKT